MASIKTFPWIRRDESVLFSQDRDRFQRVVGCVSLGETPAFQHGDALALRSQDGLENSFGNGRLGVVTVATEFDVFMIGTVGIEVVLKLCFHEFAEDSADHGAIFDVAFSKPTGRHAADVEIRFHEDHASAESGGGNGRGETAGGAAVNDDICVFGFPQRDVP